MRNMNLIKNIKRWRWAMLCLGLMALLCMAVPAWAAEAGVGKKIPGDELAKVIAGVFGVALIGFGLGAFGLVVNNVFRRRATLTYTVMMRKPGWSFLTGVIITLLGLGLIALFTGVEPLQGVILIIYLLGLGMFAAGAVVHLAAQIVEPQPMEDVLPGTWAHLKGGLILFAINIIIIVGNILFVGILLSAVGATLLGYFAGMGTAVAGLAGSSDISAGETPSEQL